MSLQFDKIPTRASQQASDDVDGPQSEFSVIVHKKREKKVRAPKDEIATDKKTTEPQSMDLKRARHDVIRFGASGLGVQEKRAAQIALAVKLGAKPPKGKAKNLKVHTQERRAQSALEKEAEEDGLLKAKRITNFHCNQLISTAQRRKRKLKDGQNTIGGYGKVSAKDVPEGKRKR